MEIKYFGINEKDLLRLSKYFEKNFTAALFPNIFTDV
jgi:hypothetical protein